MRIRPLALLLVLPICSEAIETSITVVPTWTVGEQIEYELVTSKSNTHQGTTSIGAAEKSRAFIRVLSSTRDRSVHEWRYEIDTINGQTPAKGPTEKLTQLLHSTRLRLQLDEEANILGIENAAEARATFELTIKTLIDSLPPQAVDNEGKQQILQGMQSLISDDRKLQHLATKEAQLIYSPVGGPYTLASSRQLKGSSITPFSSEPISTDNEITVSPFNESNGTFSITYSELPDSEGATRFVEQIIAQLAKATGTRTPETSDLKLQLRRVTVHVMSRDSSWPLSVQWIQTVSAGPATKEERIELTRKSLVRQQ